MESKELKLKNWHDWFKLCKTLAPKVKELEEEYQKLLKFHQENPDTTNKPPTVKNQFPTNMFVNYLLSSFFGGILIAIIGIFIKINGTRLTVLLGKPIDSLVCLIFKDLGLIQIILSVILISILFLLECGILLLPITIPLSLSMSKSSVKEYKEINNKIDNLHNELDLSMSFIPPDYRNSTCLETIYSLYTKQIATDLATATYYCDEVMRRDNIKLENNDYFPHINYNMQLMNIINKNSELEEEKIIADYDLSTTLEKENTVTDKYAEYLKKRIKNNPYLEYGHHGINDVISEGELISYAHAGSENPAEELENMIGLSKVKEQILRLNARMKFNKDEYNNGNHMVFTGNPGTGKTTVARIITGYLYQMGYIKENICVEVEGGSLKGKFVGQTSGKVKTLIDFAKGGVLFIDEAYNIMDNHDNGYGSEAIATLIKYMEDYRKDMVIILAGYKYEMQQLLDTNPGFTSRIKTKINFDNYSLDELCEILDLIKGKFSFTEEALIELKEQLDLEIDCPEFSNARDIRNWFDQIIDNHTYNWEYKTPESEKTEDKKYLITINDVIPWRNERIEYLLDKGYIRLADDEE